MSDMKPHWAVLAQCVMSAWLRIICGSGLIVYTAAERRGRAMLTNAKSRGPKPDEPKYKMRSRPGHFTRCPFASEDVLPNASQVVLPGLDSY